MSGESAPRRWAGTTLAERKEGRRERLLAAGVSLIAAGGGQAVTVRAVCREAGLTSRYFYEQFADRDDFTVAVFRSVADELQAAIATSVADASPSRGGVPRAAVDAVLGVAIDDPDKGRVLFVAPTTDPVLFAARNESLTTLASMIADQIPDRDGPEARRLKAASLTGALNQVFYLFVDGQLRVSREAFVTHCVALLRTVAALR